MDTNLKRLPLKETNDRESKEVLWQRYYKAWQASGLSMNKFCHQEGLSLSSFSGWGKRLRAKGMVFKPVVVSEAAVKNSETVIEIILPIGVRLQVPSGSDARSVGAWIKELMEWN